MLVAPTNTSHLKIHTDPIVDYPEREDVRGAAKIAESLTQATGWRFAFHPSRKQADETTSDGWAPNPAGQFVVDLPTETKAASLQVAEQLATSLSSLLEQLNETQHTLWQREAELAAGVPVVVRSDDSVHLAARLQAALRGGAEAIGCDAAAAYLMNDETTHLKLRSAWGLPAERLSSSPRELRGAMADLEALIGHAVVIEDAEQPLPWKSPETDYESAVCVPISTPSTPLGTLWMFCREPRPFSSDECNIVEIVAGRIAAELERDMVVARETAAQQIQRQLSQAGEWFTRRLPQITPLTSQWQFAASRLDNDNPGGDFYDWSVRPDGRLSAAVGDCPGFNIESLLESAALKATYHALLNTNNSPRSLMRQVNESLWSASPGDAAASMFYLAIDEDTGVMEYAFAGEPMAIAVRDNKFRSLVEAASPLGSDPDLVIPMRRRRVAPDELLILLTESARHLPLRNGERLTEAMIARAVRSFHQLDAEALQEALSQWLLAQVDGASAPKTSMLVIRRRPPRI